jgi:hypothetical protein
MVYPAVSHSNQVEGDIVIDELAKELAGVPVVDHYKRILTAEARDIISRFGVYPIVGFSVLRQKYRIDLGFSGCIWVTKKGEIVK